MRFEKPDRAPYFEQYIREDTIRRWRKEGLPRGVDIEEFFHLDHREVVPLKLSLHEMRGGFDYPIEDSDDLARFRGFLENARKRAYPRNWKKLAERYRNRDYPVGVGAWESGILQFLGVNDSPSFERACLLMCDKPKMVHAIMDAAADYLMLGIERALKDIKIDFAYFTEPIAGSNGPIISPRMFREFVIPQYRKIAKLLRERGVDIIIMRSFGNINVLLPDMVEAGITGLWMTDTIPSNMDYLEIRREYGQRLALIGGIDSNVLTRDEEAIKKEIYEIAPPLLESGGYIPTIDNRARSHIPFKNFVYYRKALEEICDLSEKKSH
jgi:uroporphyrinogen decarboxylase